MAKWNKKLGLGILNLGLLIATPNPARANDCNACDPCGSSNSCSDSCFSGIEIAADFLYWKPCVDDLTIGARVSELFTDSITSFNSRDIDYKNICPSWEPGFRITAGKDDVWCGMRISASYTWMNFDDSASISLCSGIDDGWVETPLIHPYISGRLTGTPKQYVRGEWDSTYQNWDVLLSFELCGNRCHSFSPFFGVSGLILDQSIRVDSYVDACVRRDNTPLSAHMRWENDYFGVGFKFGSDYTYQLCDGFSIFAMASGTIVSGSADNKFNRNNQWTYAANGVETRLDFEDDACCQVIPGYHLKLGINYESEMCGCESNIRLGWEYVAWHNISNPRRFDEVGAFDGDVTKYADGSYSSQANTTTIGFHGLLVGMDFAF